MRTVMQDLRNPGTLLLVVSVALSVGVLTSMLSVGEPERQNALALLPPPGLHEFIVVRTRGNQESLTWPISEAQLEAVRDTDTVWAATAGGNSMQVAKYGRKHSRVWLHGVDEFHDQIMQPGATAEHLREMLKRKGGQIEAAHVAEEARVCTVPYFEAEELGLITIDDPTPRVGPYELPVEKVKVAAVDATVRIAGHPFKVIGFHDGGVIEMPRTTFRSLFGKEFFLEVILREGGPKTDVDSSKFPKKHVQTNAALEARLQSIFQTDDRFLFDDEGYSVSLELHARSVRRLLTFGLIGAFPLAVTFFGVLGIAIVWVRDRMWVYAVLRALGATRWQVGLGAMSEPLAISCAGAVLGLLLAWVLCSGLHRAVGLEVAYNWRWFAAACATGVVAMIPPAAYIGIRAAFVPPAEALRV